MNYLKLSSYEGQNLSTVQHLTDHDQFLIFKGAFLWLSPLTIPLCLVVMLQNVVIFINYYKDRAKLVAGLFMGIADFIVVYFVFDKSPYTNKRQLHRSYLYLMMGFSVPGSGMIASLICKPDKTGDSTCHATWQFAVFGFMTFIYCVAIPLTVLICMLIQIKYLRKSFKDPDTSSQAPNDTVRHITITVLWVSVLFFICNAFYFFLMLTWGILKGAYTKSVQPK